MRKPVYEMDAVKKRILSLKGKNIKLTVHRGRKRYVRYTGVLEEIYPSVFTVRVNEQKAMDIITYSYSDVLCGDVKIALWDTVSAT
ncbi:MAG TPA: hypothetical protein GX745_06185 [Clostridiales bacterium]|jgi:uncharacterized protein Veg|nr:hypothetical protein [Clostridiales bacterium]